MRPGAAALLGGLSPKQFLHQHWQKRPLLVRNAFPGFRSPLSPEELAGLACEAGVESRLVVQTRKHPGWKLSHGPFKHTAFTRLPKSHWTLLVQDVDKHLPAAAELLEPFRFIPDWRIDDLMISYATDGGSVGPHVDAYDVFLLQAEGMRRWDISTVPQPDADIPGLELKQVRAFEPEESWLLMPGDMLYLPPGVAHHGIAFGECMTFSIGFRAPSKTEMLADFASLLVQAGDRVVQYADPDLRPSLHPGELTAAARTRAREMLRSRLRSDDETLDTWFGRYITETKPWLRPEPPSRRITIAVLRHKLAQGKGLRWHPSVRVAWFQARRHCHLFVDGGHHPLPSGLTGFGRLLGDSRRMQAEALRPHVAKPEAQALLLGFINAGQLAWTR